jgi:hypothetical protein
MKILRFFVYAKHQAKEVAQAAPSERRREAEEKKTENLNKALEKFKICPDGLTVPERHLWWLQQILQILL